MNDPGFAGGWFFNFFVFFLAGQTLRRNFSADLRDPFAGTSDFLCAAVINRHKLSAVLFCAGLFFVMICISNKEASAI